MEQVIKIEGGHQLEGEVTISGAKNATVALIPAAVLANGPVTIVGIPQIADVNNLCEILNILNIEVNNTNAIAANANPNANFTNPLDGLIIPIEKSDNITK